MWCGGDGQCCRVSYPPTGHGSRSDLRTTWPRAGLCGLWSAAAEGASEPVDAALAPGGAGRPVVCVHGTLWRPAAVPMAMGRSAPSQSGVAGRPRRGDGLCPRTPHRTDAEKLRSNGGGGGGRPGAGRLRGPQVRRLKTRGYCREREVPSANCPPPPSMLQYRRIRPSEEKWHPGIATWRSVSVRAVWRQ